MKTFQQFQESVASAILKVGKKNILPALMSGIGAAGTILQATKQGEGGRSQPVDYGQGRSTQSRKPAVQRGGRISSNDAYNRQKKEERRAEAQRRARERAEQGIDELIGSDAERKAAAEARANQSQIQRELRRKNMRDRMRKAAEEQGFD